MPATVILTTQATALQATWSQQLPLPATVPATDDALILELKRPGARVWVKDLRSPQALFAAHEDTVIVAVGEPHSVPYVEARHSRRVAFCLSYDESAKLLQQVVAMAGELAEKRTVVSVLAERQTTGARGVVPAAAAAGSRTLGELDFIEAALDHLADRPGIVDAFKRGLRARLRAARVAIFLRDDRHFVAEAEGWRCACTDPLVLWLQEHAALVDAEALDAIDQPLTVALVRQAMATWNARLLVPVAVEGSLAGWVAFGPRADARRYSEQDYDQALQLVSLFGRVLAQHEGLRRAQTAAEDVRILNAHGPQYRVIRRGEAAPEGVAVEVRELVGLARRENRRVEREMGALRVTAGPLGDTGDFWVLWDGEGGSGSAVARKLEDERFRMLHDLGLILSHELSNALLSVSTFFQHQKQGPQVNEIPGLAALTHRVELDMVRLKEMPHILDAVYEMTQRPPALVDMQRLLYGVAKDVDGVADFSDAAITLWGHEENLRQALVWLCREVKENRDDSQAWPAEKITLRLQERQRGEEKICLVYIAYSGLRLDQIKTGAAESVNEFPTTPVYLAREVIRYHYGTIHVGQGARGPELYVSLRSRPLTETPAKAAPVASPPVSVGGAQVATPRV